MFKRKTNMAEAWFNKGTTFANLGKYEEAEKCFDEAEKRNPDLAER